MFLDNKIHSVKSTSVLLSKSLLYYLIMHFRMTSNFYTSQLVDIFAYNLPVSSKQDFDLSDDSILVYNLHNLNFQNRFYLFTAGLSSKVKQLPLLSVAEIFPNANWLEREIAELHGSLFGGKKDVRNLMLQYGDSSNPFLKFYPSVGYKEMIYDVFLGIVIQQNTTVQS